MGIKWNTHGYARWPAPALCVQLNLLTAVHMLHTHTHTNECCIARSIMDTTYVMPIVIIIWLARIKLSSALCVYPSQFCSAVVSSQCYPWLSTESRKRETRHLWLYLMKLLNSHADRLLTTIVKLKRGGNCSSDFGQWNCTRFCGLILIDWRTSMITHAKKQILSWAYLSLLGKNTRCICYLRRAFSFHPLWFMNKKAECFIWVEYHRHWNIRNNWTSINTTIVHPKHFSTNITIQSW